VNFDAILNWLGKHISWRYLLGIFGATGTLLFFCGRLGVCTWVDQVRGWLVAAFIFSGVVLLSYPASGIYKWMAAYIHDTRVMFIGKKHLKNLNPAEKAICKNFLDTKGNPLLHNPKNGATASLVVKGIIYPVRAPRPNGMCNFNIQPWAIGYLKKHSKLVEE
jgi:Super-infection exclusion protein B